MVTQTQLKVGDLCHTGDYYVYEVVKVEKLITTVTPAFGYPLQWGDEEGKEYGYRHDLLHPGDCK